MAKNPKSSAEKRALWEIRRRYGMHQSQPKARRSPSGSRQPVSPASRPARRSARAARKAARRPTVQPSITPQSGQVEPKHRKRSFFGRLLIVIIFLMIISGGIFGYKVIAAGDKISAAERSILGQLKDLFLSQGNVLDGEQEGRINIMLIAVGGEGHKGEDLADTIMVASIDPATNRAALLSIPRDLYVQVPDQEYYSKINAVHAYGESQKRDDGPELLSKLVADIIGQPIHYYVRVDFTAFKSIVDAVGGINITVDNTFFDYWHKISFPAGIEKMNGERSLAYVRARYIEGPEGGDFKRAARQQQVLLALREKVFSVQTALDFTKVNTILNSLSDNIRTDMQLWEMKRAFELARLVDPGTVHSEVLTSGPKGVLVGGTEVLGGVPASVLHPRTGDFSEIRTIAANMLNHTQPIQDQALESADDALLLPEPDTESEEEPPAPEPAPETAKPTIEVRNGTNITGLAKRTSDNLEDAGYTVTTIGNAATRDHTASTIHLTDTEFTDGAQNLASVIGAAIENELPDNEPATNAQVLLILGTDAE